MKRSRVSGRGSSDYGSPSSSHSRKKARLRPEDNPEEEDGGTSEMDTSQSLDLVVSPIESQEEGTAQFKSEKVVSEAEVGVIDKLTLVNFMCHRRLDLSLSPNVNFILGRNGSGKSAIMTGIVVGLGGNARNTERGRSLKQFIRTGERTGEIRVTLRNRGTEAYRSDVYGEAIIVERAINNDGTGSYKIRSSAGKVISNKKEELINILDHCGVQVDNPVSLLNQDTSRHFLQKSKPGEKYKLFMKATHLEQIATDYEQAELDQRIMREGIKRQEKLLPEFESQAKKLEEKVETFKRLVDMEGRVKQLEMELQWAIVGELEREIIPIEQDIDKAKVRITRNEKKKAETEGVVVRMESEEKGVRDQLREAVQEASSIQTEREGVMKEKREIERSIRELGQKIRQLSGQIKDKETEKGCLEETRENCIALSQRDVAGEKALREKEVEKLQKKLALVEGEVATAENDRRQFDGAVKQGREKESELRKKIKDEEDALGKSNDRLQRLKSSHNDSLAMFGPQMKELVDAVQKNLSRFEHPPIGPLGALIKLKDYTWATAVEQLSRSLLHAFVVDNHRDEEVLREIVRRVYKGGKSGRMPEVVKSTFQGTVYDVRKNRPHCDHPTVLDMLNVQNPNVLNVLIDQLSVESILLIHSREDASRVIVRERPQGAKSAYTVEGDQVLQYAHYSNKFGKMGILKESVEAAIRDEEAQYATHRNALVELKEELEEVRRRVSREQRSVHDATGKVKRKNAERAKIRAAMEELQNAQEEEEPEEDIATYDAEISELEQVIAGLREHQQDLHNEGKRLDAEKKECFQKCEAYNKEADQISSKVVKLKADVGDTSHKKHEAMEKVRFYRDKITEIQGIISVLQANIRLQNDKVEAAKEAAEKVCPRMNTERSHQSIESEVRKLRRRIDQELPDKSEQVEVEKEFFVAKNRFRDTKSAVKNEKKSLKKLQHGMEHRRKSYLFLQDRIAHRTRIYFARSLQERDYDGTLKFNHESEELEINVRVDRHTEESKSTKNTKSLSGGERSFTTVCFIMSLWEAMEAPFRCLDEFDVFMDMMNRRISMRLMMEHAQEQPNRQFIFFTPQDMSSMGIKTDDMVKILKLNPPERGDQTTLNLRQ